MSKKLLFFSLLAIITISLVVYAVRVPNQEMKNDQIVVKNSDNTSLGQIAEDEMIADTIEVIHFHATQQCWSCTTVGKYALKTIKEKFPEEYQSGVIVFKDINGELPENKDMVMKYQAGGSSLFINAITAGKDSIKEDVTVWRLVGNESQFVIYFENKLNKLLGK